MPNTMVIAGATGMIGSHLRKHFEHIGWRVVALGRNELMLSPEQLSGIISGAAVVVNLAGAPLIRRWSESHKQSIYNSRILSTRKLVAAIAIAEQKPQLLISASAVGIYNQECIQDEFSNQFADDFPGKVCLDWEAEAENASGYTRLIILRLGVVLSMEGGALKTMLPIFRLGLGGKIGSGLQPFAWIHIADVISSIAFFIDVKETSGVYNLVAPHLINNRKFTTALANALHRPAWFTVPAWLLKLVFGEASVTLTGGQKVVPMRLQKANFVFGFHTIEEALLNLLSSAKSK
ncbi:MAG TPA: TIGR01777 family oxidoreductase [Bacteroidales bacterium]|nr:TIGR01777 family oxidoreductase [Bacteroidales bacterium]